MNTAARSSRSPICEEAARLLEDAVENTAPPFWVSDLDGRIVRSNHAFAELLGYSPSELSEMRAPADLLHESESGCVTALEKRRRKRRIEHYRKRDGSPVPVEVSAGVLRDSQGRVRYRYAFVQDLTERERDRHRRESVIRKVRAQKQRLTSLAEELEEAHRLSEALNRINEDILRIRDPQRTIRHVVDHAGEALGADASALLMRDEGALRVTQVRGRRKLFEVGRDVPESMVPRELLRHQREPLVAEDLEGESWADLAPVRGTRSAILVPVPSRDGLAGLLFFAYREPRRFSEAQIDFAHKLLTTMSLAVENQRLADHERYIANTLQEALLSPPPQLECLEVAHLYRSATDGAHVGGDFYDVYELPDGSVALAVGDVSGKGVDAAATTALVKNALRAAAFVGGSPAEVLGLTNEVVQRFTEVETYVTLFFGILDRDSGGLVYATAGHPSPLLIGEDGDIRKLDTHDPVLGAYRQARYFDGQQVMRSGDVLLLYTDGLLETRRAGSRERYGEDRLTHAIREATACSAEQVLECVFQDVIAFSHGRLDDDTAVLAVRFRPETAPGVSL